MPLLTPNEDEEKNDFISRFVSDDNMMSEYPSRKQRLAVAYSQWDGDGEEQETADKSNFSFILLLLILGIPLVYYILGQKTK